MEPNRQQFDSSCEKENRSLSGVSGTPTDAMPESVMRLLAELYARRHPGMRFEFERDR